MESSYVRAVSSVRKVPLKIHVLMTPPSNLPIILCRPLQRISAISSLSLTDIPSLAGSMTSSARLQAKNRRSRSGSRSGSSHKSPQNSLSRATSRASMSSHNHSHSARSRSGSGSEGGQMGSKASSRRNNNSSSGSNASSGHGSHRSVKSGRTALGRVMEDGEAVPPLPPKPSAYA